MRTQTRNRKRRFTVLASAAGVVALVATGLALAGMSTPVSHVYTLKANLAPAHVTNPASTAIGHFSGVLVWSRGGTAVGPLPAGCVKTVPRRSGLPYRITCDHGNVTITPSKTTGWTLYWVLTYSHLSGTAMAGDIRTSLPPSAVQFTLFTTPVALRGHVAVNASQAKALMLGKDYAGINTKVSTPEIRGTITSSAH